VQGDVKSANVLIFGDFETAKLCDFGVSRKIKEDGTIEGEYAGTEWWSPMEVILTRDGEIVENDYAYKMIGWGFELFVVVIRGQEIQCNEQS